MQFKEGVVECSESDIDRLIAHELAHVYDFAVGGPSSDDDPQVLLWVERRAVHVARRWGFGMPFDKDVLVHYRAYAKTVCGCFEGIDGPDHTRVPIVRHQLARLNQMLAS